MRLSGLFQTRPDMAEAARKPYKKTGSISYLGSGFYFVSVSPNGGAYVLRQITDRRWGIFEVSSAVMLELQRNEWLPVESAKLILVETGKARCLEALARMVAN